MPSIVRDVVGPGEIAPLSRKLSESNVRRPARGSDASRRHRPDNAPWRSTFSRCRDTPAPLSLEVRANPIARSSVSGYFCARGVAFLSGYADTDSSRSPRGRTSKSRGEKYATRTRVLFFPFFLRANFAAKRLSNGITSPLAAGRLIFFYRRYV